VAFFLVDGTAAGLAEVRDPAASRLQGPKAATNQWKRGKIESLVVIYYVLTVQLRLK